MGSQSILKKQDEKQLTEGKILPSLLFFAFPVLLALFLQAMYGAADLMIVGHFSGTFDQSGVASGSQLLCLTTMVVTGFSMGVTVYIGNAVGAGNPERAGRGIGNATLLFGTVAVLLTFILVLFSEPLAGILDAPPEAFSATASYIRICGFGSLFIIAYNLLGAVFRGLGDSKTPLMTVAVACVVNIIGDLFLVGYLHLGATGAAAATVTAQALSVFVSLLVLRNRTLPFTIRREDFSYDAETFRKIVLVGLPIGFQELLVQFSFLFIQIVVNGMGVRASAGIGVAEKVISFLMLVSSAYMQSMSAFVAQNMGAGKYRRARKAVFYGMATGVFAGSLTWSLAFFFGDVLSGLFTSEQAVILLSHEYLKGFSFDCMLTAVLFCFIGYFNGSGKTLFVMLQGVAGAFLIRTPIVYFLSTTEWAGLFHIAAATPISSVIQIGMCIAAYRYYRNDLCPDLAPRVSAD